MQEVLSVTTMSETFKYALQMGLYTVALDSKWQVQTFQFYMGDLSNVIPEASKYLPDA